MEKRHLDLAVALRHELHQHPELAYQELWTKERLISFLHHHSSLEVVDRGHWFYAQYRAGKDRPNIAFRADFDALPIDETISLPYGSRIPGVAHKCGHDGHSACLAGFALDVNDHGADKNIYFVFQHAEETVQGGFECALLMEEEHIAEVFAYHNVPGMPVHSIAVADDIASCGSTGMIITLTGIPAHASQPEDGRNPCFAIAEIINSIPAFTDPAGYRGLVLCTIIRIDAGKEAFGMSASEGRLLLTIRSQFDIELEELRKRIEEKTREKAEHYGLKYGFDFRDSVPALHNHRESAAKVRGAARRLGLSTLEVDGPARGSEDFAWYTKRTRGAMFWVGAGEERSPIHSPEFDFNDEIIPTVVDLYRALADEPGETEGDKTRS
ncbi:MAG: amidohydrolase [Treponema sp.]|jgi:amidohydrolase|nr:amidohydrolase [Treponema sp.]